METNLFMGCDIGQDSFHYCLRNRREILLQGQVANNTTSIRKWLTDLKKVKQVDLSAILFCMEHTGIYGQILMRVLHQRGLIVCLESATAIKLSLGMQRGKNDKVDAQRIAEYAFRFTDRLKAWKPKSTALTKLSHLSSARSRLIKTYTILSRHLTDAKRFLSSAEYQLIKKSCQQSINAIQKNIKSMDATIVATINSDENLQELSSYVTSVHGVGMVTCAAILVKTNAFQDYTDAKKFACTAGLAPFEHTSGTSVRGKTRVSHRAHKDIKTLLHMCAIGCIGRKGEYKDYYDRKVREGKNKMSVINAVRNKLIHRIFAVVRDKVMYEKNYQYGLVMS